MNSAFDGLPKTPNLSLNKPGYDNVADIEALNENADILDEEINTIKSNLKNKGSATEPVYFDGNGVPQKTKNFNDYLPLAGGQMTDTIISRSVNDSLLALIGGTNEDNGATLMLYGKDNSDGKFLIRANNGTAKIDLVGTAGGGLTWDNKEVFHSGKTIPIANGGTGANNASDALKNLGIDGAIVGLSVSGKTITYNKKDGTSGTITTQDTVPSRYITSKYQSGTNWYEVYNDGWVRQGGLATAQNTTYTFLKPFKDTNFSFTTGLHHFFNNHNQGVTIKSLTATNFQLNMWYGEAGSGNGNTRWVAEGYGA